MSRFWKNWLDLWVVAVAAFGVFLISGAWPASEHAIVALLDLLNGVAPLETSQPLRFAFALLGAITIGWAMTLYVAIQAAHALGPAGRPIWLGLTAAVAAWYAIDSTLSVMTGYALNAASNTVFAAAFLWPVLASRVLWAEEERHALT
jgi:hypothetical protein